MARIARVVVPSCPHHITQRGNRRLDTFFCDQDYRAYLSLMAEWCFRCDVEVWAYCLMPNHVHLIAVPKSEDGLRRAIGEAHRRYTRMVNFREGWRGHLWQGRFCSFPLSESYLLSVARYVERNPVRAGLAGRPEAYPWSSAAAHISGRDDVLVRVSPLLGIVGDWDGFLSPAEGEEGEEGEEIRRHERTGRPLGNEDFIIGIENLLARILRKQKPGPKAKARKR
jgi:putative transposase